MRLSARVNKYERPGSRRPLPAATALQSARVMYFVYTSGASAHHYQKLQLTIITLPGSGDYR